MIQGLYKELKHDIDFKTWFQNVLIHELQTNHTIVKK